MEKNYDELPGDQAAALLKKLGSDDGFRDLFATDPRQALAQIGHAPAADANVTSGIWESLKVSKLADKATIEKSYAQLHRDLTQAKSTATPISLDLSPKR
jgi:putative modified peptide